MISHRLFSMSLIISSITSLNFPAYAQSTSARAASEIPDRRDFPVSAKVKPCDDFYEYACSESTQPFVMRADRSKHTFAFDDSAERLLSKKTAFLGELAEKAQKSAAELSPRSRALGTVYAACMDAQSSGVEEKTWVATALKNMAAIKTHQEFARFLAVERRSARTHFLQLGNLANQNAPDTYDFYFSANAMTLPERSYYENPAVVKDYRNVLEEFFKTIGWPSSDQANKANKVAGDVLSFESAFAQVYPLPAEWREIMVKKSYLSRGDLVQKYPSFHLQEFLAQIPQTTLIRDLTPETYQWLHTRLQEENLETLKAVYLFQRLGSQLDDAYPRFQKLYYDFEAKHLGTPQTRPPRQERCAKFVMHTFTKELDAELLPLVFPNFQMEKFTDLAEKVRSSILLGIDSNTWLSEQGKKGALEKMATAKLQLVKPLTNDEWYFNPDAVYSLTKPRGNSETLAAKLQERDFEELKQKRNPNVWHMGPLTVNAYYSPSDNKFVMPIGILQYPFYDPQLPLEVNLGAVGAVIGHELGHGIDDKGAQYDASGRQVNWMTDKDRETFKARGKGLIQQFDEIGHNGTLTLGENIGDLTGVTFAYRAAFPGGVGTPEMKRAFFLQYARLWCQVMLPAKRAMLLKVDSHALGWARVNQPLKNLAEFAAAYQCTATDKMSLPSDQRINIW